MRINVNASVDILYAAWATRVGIESWFLRLSEYKLTDDILRKSDEPVQKGDKYKWLWHGWSDETVEFGEILDCNDKDLFKFSFGKAGNCTVKIYSEQNENIVELAQDDIPTAKP